jgi:hypothetical protein
MRARALAGRALSMCDGRAAALPRCAALLTASSTSWLLLVILQYWLLPIASYCSRHC